MIIQEYDWVWSPESILFKPLRYVHDATYGKIPHEYGSAHWIFELSLPPQKEKDRKQIVAFLARVAGVAVVNIYDPRVPIPDAYNKYLNDSRLVSRIPDLSVLAVSKPDRTITVQGEVGDRVTVDDPIAFTHDGVRHYYRALETVDMDGTPIDIMVNLRPRVSLDGLNIVTDRIKPTCRFQIDTGDIQQPTDVNGFTRFTLSGVEFSGRIDDAG